MGVKENDVLSSTPVHPGVARVTNTELALPNQASLINRYNTLLEKVTTPISRSVIDNDDFDRVAIVMRESLPNRSFDPRPLVM